MWRIDADDAPEMDLLTQFDQTHTWISENISSGGKVLVHCFAGVSRSASIVIAYIMKEFKMDYKNARSLVSRARKIIEPNYGFERQLQFYSALGCSLSGGSEAHTSLDEMILKDGSGKLDASLFLDRWEHLQRHL
jgi:hypothetical protein